MTDFIKLRILNPDIPRIRNNPRLEWEQTTRERTGEIKEYTAKYNGLTFEIINNQHLNVSGSLHKFWNSINGRREQNYNDFRFSDLAGVIIDFCELFNLVPGSCIIENFEFGVNVSPGIPTAEILRSVINHKGKPFERRKTERMYYLECVHWQYYLKIYDKGLQYDQGNLLRFEVKTRKMEIVRTAKIHTLSDLLIPFNYKRLGVILSKYFSEIMFYDYTIPDTGINARDRLILTQGMNPAFWETYIKTNPDNYYKKRDRFKDLVTRYGKQDISKIVGKLVSQKWDDLLKTDLETLQKLTGVAKMKFTEIDTSYIVTNSVNSFQAEDGPTGPLAGRYCQSCGKDISHQRPETKFCSAKFVGEKQAHKCRNIDSNPRNNDKNKIELQKKNGISFLFDPVQLLNERRAENRVLFTC